MLLFGPEFYVLTPNLKTENWIFRCIAERSFYKKKNREKTIAIQIEKKNDNIFKIYYFVVECDNLNAKKGKILSIRIAVYSIILKWQWL